jgi:hypothetical protein
MGMTWRGVVGDLEPWMSADQQAFALRERWVRFVRFV